MRVEAFPASLGIRFGLVCMLMVLRLPIPIQASISVRVNMRYYQRVGPASYRCQRNRAGSPVLTPRLFLPVLKAQQHGRNLPFCTLNDESSPSTSDQTPVAVPKQAYGLATRSDQVPVAYLSTQAGQRDRQHVLGLCLLCFSLPVLFATRFRHCVHYSDFLPIQR